MAEQVEQIKWVPNTRFMVDGFRFQSPRCKHYWLSHYHSDHTIGLTTSFSAGTIYCSAVTANLLVKDMRINPSCIQPLPLNTPLLVEGINVTLIDANHCPGAVLFLFKTPPPPGSEFTEQVILHTGDMRWHPRMGHHPALKNQRIDMLYLDTTYASPKHVFPCQEDAIADIVRVMRQEDKAHPQALFIVGSYRIGKERAYLGAAKALGWKVHVNADKLRVLRLLGLPEADMAVLTRDATEARIHVSFMGKLLMPDALTERMRAGPWTHVVAFRPTGWSFQKSGLSCRREGDVAIYGVPYSEHSSFPELRDCVKTLRPRRIVPTVNASSPAAARALVDRFADLMDLSRDRSRLDFFLCKAKTAPSNIASAPPSGLITESCPSAACDEAADARGQLPGPAALDQAPHRVQSAPGELAADSAPGGAWSGSEAAAERSTHGAGNEECGSEACSELGEDADGDENAAVDLVSPEKGAAPNEEWREQGPGVSKRREGEVAETQRGDNAFGSKAQRAQRAAELVHLGLDSPPEPGGAAAEPPSAAAAHLHGSSSDACRGSEPGPPETAADKEGGGQASEAVEGQRFQCAWPQQERGLGTSDSANDSWSSDSWVCGAEPAAQASAQECAESGERRCQEVQGTVQHPDCPGCDREADLPSLSQQQFQPACTGAGSEARWTSDLASVPSVQLKAEEPLPESVESREDASEQRGHSSKADRTEGLPKEAAVDLLAVDVAEQERILRAIELQRLARPGKGCGEQGRKRGQGLAAGGNSVALVHGGALGSQTKRRQLSIGAFILKMPSSK